MAGYRYVKAEELLAREPSWLQAIAAGESDDDDRDSHAVGGWDPLSRVSEPQRASAGGGSAGEMSLMDGPMGSTVVWFDARDDRHRHPQPEPEPDLESEPEPEPEPEPELEPDVSMAHPRSLGPPPMGTGAHTVAPLQGLIDKVTENNESPAPGWALDQMARLTVQTPGIELEMVELLYKRLQKNACNVKLKTLRAMHFIARRDSVAFRRAMQRGSQVIRQHLTIQGNPHPVHGDAPWRLIRDTAKEVMNAIHDTSKDDAPAAPMKKMEGPVTIQTPAAAAPQPTAEEAAPPVDPMFAGMGAAAAPQAAAAPGGGVVEHFVKLTDTNAVIANHFLVRSRGDLRRAVDAFFSAQHDDIRMARSGGLALVRESSAKEQAARSHAKDEARQLHDQTDALQAKLLETQAAIAEHELTALRRKPGLQLEAQQGIASCVDYKQKMNCHKAVCRILVISGASQTVGSGSLVDGTPVGFPRACILTNQHVLPNAETARVAMVTFNFDGPDSRKYVEKSLDPELGFIAWKDDHLDFCLVACNEDDIELSEVQDTPHPSPLPMDADAKVSVGWPIEIWQHPRGEFKQVSSFLPHEVTDTQLKYKNDTAKGSSGAPIFNNACQLVGIHYAGEAARANYGCRLSAIVGFILSHPELVTKAPDSHEGGAYDEDELSDMGLCMTDCRAAEPLGDGDDVDGGAGVDEAWAIRRSVWWKNGSSLRVYFLGSRDGRVRYASDIKRPQGGKPWPDAGPDVENWVLQTANEWSKYCNISFVRARSRKKADIIVCFNKGGSCSHVGNQSKGRCPSMQLGWVHRDYTARNPGTVLHEFGHALGLKHEQQHPVAGIPYDEAKVLKYYAGEPNKWDEEKIRHNVLNPPSKTNVLGQYDRDSIMHYVVAQKLLKPGHTSPLTKKNVVLSMGDKRFVAKMYPKPKAPITFLSDLLKDEEHLSLREIMQLSETALQDLLHEHKVQVRFRKGIVQEVQHEREKEAVSWCATGVYVKQGSKTGKVLMDPNDHLDVKVRWADGKDSDWITAADLVQSSYSEFSAAQQVLRTQAAREKVSWCTKGTVVMVGCLPGCINPAQNLHACSCPHYTALIPDKIGVVITDRPDQGLDVIVRFANGDESGYIKAADLSRSSKEQFAAAQQAVLRERVSWCTRGTPVTHRKEHPGKVGKVTMDPDRDLEVKVRWSNGQESGYIKAADLEKSSEAAFAVGNIRAGVVVKQGRKVGKVTMDPDRDLEVKVRWSNGQESCYIKAAELSLSNEAAFAAAVEAAKLAELIRTAAEAGLAVGAAVTWTGSNSDVPRGAIGKITEFVLADGGRARAQFPNGTWRFRLEDLRPLPTCSKGHALAIARRNEHSCDVCDSSPTKWRCNSCDYDMCHSCYANGGEPMTEANVKKLPALEVTGAKVAKCNGKYYQAGGGDTNPSGRSSYRQIGNRSMRLLYDTKGGHWAIQTSEELFYYKDSKKGLPPAEGWVRAKSPHPKEPNLSVRML